MKRQLKLLEMRATLSELRYIIEKCTERYPLQNGIFFTSFISRYVQFGAAIAAGLFYGDPKN